MKSCITLLTVLAALAVVHSQKLIAPRMINGIPIDTLRRFPSHVNIQPQYLDREEISNCGGTILNDQWILTSARCVDGSYRLQLNFEKLYQYSDDGSYSVMVSSKSVHIYPTYYDDIALVKLPLRLVFSDTIKPVQISYTPLDQWVNKLAVLPGFNANESGVRSDKSQLTYAMLKILPNEKCKGIPEFDEYLQLCTESWGQSSNTPCLNENGSSLIVNWPAKSEIIGVYSRFSDDCNSSSPSVYTYAAKYSTWIDSVINSNF